MEEEDYQHRNFAQQLWHTLRIIAYTVRENLFYKRKCEYCGRRYYGDAIYCSKSCADSAWNEVVLFDLRTDGLSR